MKERCDNCRFGRAQGNGMISCRRHGPTVQTVQEWAQCGEGPCAPMLPYTEWPMIAPNEWCGEWAPKADAVDEPDDGIREAAIAYVWLRRAKLNVREGLRYHTRQHHLDCEGEPPCYLQGTGNVGGAPLESDEWCEDCQKAQPLYERHGRLVRKTATALERLERRVNKAEGRSAHATDGEAI